MHAISTQCASVLRFGEQIVIHTCLQRSISKSADNTSQPEQTISKTLLVRQQAYRRDDVLLKQLPAPLLPNVARSAHDLTDKRTHDRVFNLFPPLSSSIHLPISSSYLVTLSTNFLYPFTTLGRRPLFAYFIIDPAP